jgi:hypothetical protein
MNITFHMISDIVYDLVAKKKFSDVNCYKFDSENLNNNLLLRIDELIELVSKSYTIRKLNTFNSLRYSLQKNR